MRAVPGFRVVHSSTKVILSLIVLFLCISTVSAIDLGWQKSLGGSGDDMARSIQPTIGGGYIVAGYTASNDGDVSGYHGDRDILISDNGTQTEGSPKISSDPNSSITAVNDTTQFPMVLDNVTQGDLAQDNNSQAAPQMSPAESPAEQENLTPAPAVTTSFDANGTPPRDETAQRGSSITAIVTGGNTEIRYGEMLNGSLTAGGQVDTYTFTAPAGDAILAWGYGANLYPTVQICYSNGTLLDQKVEYGSSSGSSYVEVTARAEETGSYLLTMSSWYSYTGTYRLYLQRINNPAGAASLSFGTTVNGSTEVPAEMDVYTISADAGDAILARAVSHSSFYPQIRLYHPNGTLLQRVSAWWNIRNYTDLSATITEPGSYTLMLQDALRSGTGSYSFYLQNTKNPVNSTQIAFGQVINASLEDFVRLDAYTFPATSGDAILARVITTWTDGPELRLYAPNGSMLLSASGRNTLAELTSSLPESGTYTILTGSYNGKNSGPYALWIQCVNHPAAATSISFGETVYSSIKPPVELDAYTFPASAGDTILVHPRTGTPLWTRIRLYAPNGSLLGTTFRYEGEQFISAQLQETGSYTIIGSCSGCTYPYSFFIQCLNNPLHSTPVAYGTASEGNFLPDGEIDTYTFPGQDGDLLYLRLGSGDSTNSHLSTYLDLFTSDGIHLSSNKSSYYTVAEILQILHRTDTYVFLVEGDGSETRSYPFSLNNLKDSSLAIPILPGEKKQGELPNLSAFTLYSFTGTDGDFILLRLTSILYQPIRLRLLDPAWNLIDKITCYRGSCYTDSFILRSLLNRTGSYSVLIDAPCGEENINTYNLTFSSTRPPNLQHGSQYWGNISPGVLEISYIDVPDNETLRVTVAPFLNSSNFILYGSWERIPGKGSFDFSQTEKNPWGAYDLLISPTNRGRYIFNISSESTKAEGYTIVVSLKEQYVTTVYPRTVSNTSQVFVHIYGTGFSDGLRVYLTKNLTVFAEAQEVILASRTMLITRYDLSPVPFGTYDIVVEWPDASRETIPSSLIVSERNEGVIYEDPYLSVLPGTPVNRSFVVQDLQNLFITLQKKENWWSDTITLYRDGTEVASDSSRYEQIIHIPNPANGNYTLSISSGSQGTAFLTICSQLPELPRGGWVVAPIYAPYGSTYHQFTVPPGQDNVSFRAEAMSDASHFNIYRGQWGSSEHWMGSYGLSAEVLIPNPQPGLYIVEFIDGQMISGGDSQKRDVMIMADIGAPPSKEPVSYLPVISGITPTKGGNSGIVSVTVRGAWLDPNATVSLVRTGLDPINASEVQGSPARTSLIATFDLAKKAPGVYSLIVSRPDGKTATSPVPFSIEEGGKGDFWIELVGREVIRVGRPVTYVIKYGNRGSVDMPAQAVVVSTEPEVSGVYIREKPPLSGPDQPWQELKGDIVFLAHGGDKYPDILPAGYSGSIDLDLRSDGTTPFRLRVVPLSGDPVFTPPVVAADVDASFPAPGIPLFFSRVFPAGYFSHPGALGYGWESNFDLKLETISNYGGRFLSLKSFSDQGCILFEYAGNGIYRSVGGNTTLKKNTDGTYLLQERDGSTIHFRTDMKADAIRDQNGNQITLSYDGNGRLTGIGHSSGAHFSIGYNSDNRIVRLTDPAGLVTNYSYDQTGTLLTSVSKPDGSATSYGYSGDEGAFALTQVLYPSGLVQSIAFDAEGRLTESSLNDGEEMFRYAYDSVHRETTITDAEGAETLIRVNEFGSPVSIQNPSGAVWRYEYDSDQNLVQTVSPMGSAAHLQYDEDRNVIRVTDPLSNTLAYQYNSQFNKISAITDPRGNHINVGYDTRGNPHEITYPDSTREIMAHDMQGNIEQYTTRGGNTILSMYNEKGQMLNKTYPDGSWAGYTYDDAGNMVSASDPNGTIRMEYNIRHQLTRITYPCGYWLNYTYDSSGRLTRKSLWDGRALAYEYDALGHLSRISDENNREIVRYRYDDAGRLVKKLLPSNASTTYIYDADGQITRLANYHGNGTILSFFDYSYDPDGNVIAADTPEGRYTYEYDAIGQLTKVTSPDGSRTRFTYDGAGNRISMETDGNAIAYTTNALNQYTHAGPATFTYDANGNLASKTEGSNTTTYTYDMDSRLTGVSSPEGTWEYRYDALGNRAVTVRDGTEHHYVIDPLGYGDVVADYTGDGTLIARYTHGLGLISQQTPDGSSYEYHFSPTGHTVQITDPSGQVVNRYRYAPFGEYLEREEGISNPFTFVGESGVMDEGNGLSFMRMRFFDGAMGRFLSTDPTYSGSNMNFYLYAFNSPIDFVDPIGLFGSVPPPEERNDLQNKIFKKESDNWAEEINHRFNAEAYYYAKLHEAPSDRERQVTTYERQAPLTALSVQVDFTEKVFLWFEKPLAVVPFVFHYWAHEMPSQPEGDEHRRDRPDPPPPPPPPEQQRRIDPRGIVDPEDKYGPIGFDLPDTLPGDAHRDVPQGQHFSYRVDFWNAENATAPVCDAYAYDRMDPAFNRSTFAFTEAGFLNWTVPLEPCQYFNVNVDPRPYLNLIVNIEGRYDPGTGMANWTYRTWDPVTLTTPEDPMVGFLPPITSSGNEIAWFSFEIDPKPDLTSGTVIENRAWVNFDNTTFMPAPKDYPYRNTIDAGKPSSALTASLRNRTEILVSLTGSDDTSGVRDYSIYVSMDNGSYMPYKDHMTESSAAITGIGGHRYRLYSIASDNTSNIEDAPSMPDATIDVPVPLIADFSASQRAGHPLMIVSFFDESRGAPASWKWSFGDGNFSEEQNPVHTYASLGTFNVTLTVTDSGGTDSLVETNYITLTPTPLVASFTANITSGTLPLTVRFTDTSTGSPAAWNWSFGDGNFSTVQNATHTYEFNGTFTVSLNVTSESGHNTATRTHYITVNNPAPVSRHGINVTVEHIPGLSMNAEHIHLFNGTWCDNITWDDQYSANWDGLAVGEKYTLFVGKAGYLNVSGDVTVTGGNPRWVNVTLLQCGEMFTPAVVLSENGTVISNIASFYQASTGEWVNTPANKHKENLSYEMPIAGNDTVGVAVEVPSRLTVNVTANGNRAITVMIGGSNALYQFVNGTFTVDDSGFFTTTNATILVVAPAGSDGQIIHIQFDGTVNGDGTGDGSVTAADALMATRTALRLTNIPTTHDYADVSSPFGRFTAADTLGIIRNALGLVDY